MRLITFLLLILVPVVSFGQGFPFVVDGGCSSVSLDRNASGFDHGGLYVDIVDGGPHHMVPQDNDCSWLLLTPATKLIPKFKLQKKNASGNWQDASSLTTQTTFNNLSKGTYRLVSPGPVAILRPNFCVSFQGRTLMYDFLGRHIGYKGQMVSPLLESEEVVVGFTSQSDIQDIDNSFMFENGTPGDDFNDQDRVRLDLSQSTNFDRWFIAIQQLVGGSNYQSSGWQEGHIEDYDLWGLWTRNGTRSGWRFWNNKEFRVQVVLENTSCRNGVWNQKFGTFTTCANGGCRFLENRDLPISIFPNPAEDLIVFKNLIVLPEDVYIFTISDMAGKIIRTDRLPGNEIDIQDLKTGAYVINIEVNGELVFASKLMKK
jgi:hypothetical protein